MRAMVAVLVALLLVAPAAAQPAPPHRVSLPLLAAPPRTTLADLEAVAALGLLWPSETDAPLEVVRVEGADAADACARMGGEVRPFDRVFNGLAEGAWGALRAAVLRLDAPLACHVGGVRGSLYLLGGVAEGGVAGLRALVVET